ncbi:MAG: CvpA family protein [Actinomycetota bacterium]
MIFDILLTLGALGAVISGFKRGFLQTLIATVGFVGGGILGLVIALHFVEDNKNTTAKFFIAFLGIIIGSEICKWIASGVARFFRTKILWSPIRFIDSIAGAVLELARLTVVSYLVLSVLLYSPWQWINNSVSDSKIYRQMKIQEPDVIDRFRAEIDKKMAIIPR